MAEADRDRYLADLCDRFVSELEKSSPQLVDPHGRAGASSIVETTLRTAHSQQIFDELQLLNLSVIHLAIGANPLLMDAFSYVTKNSHLHPYAKARHIILSFFAVQNMSHGG